MNSSSLPGVTASERDSIAEEQIAGGGGSESLFPESMQIAWLLAAAAVLLQMLTNGR